MLTARKKIIFAVIAVFILAWIVGTASTFQHCIGNYENQQANQPPKERHTILGIVVNCAWETLDKNHDAVIALFTIVIGIFTSLLFLDGRDKARKELRAYMTIRDGSLYFLPNGILRAHVEMFNAGRTPARDVSVFVHGEAAPVGHRPNFEDRPFIPHMQPIAPGSQWTVGHEFIDHSREMSQSIITGLHLVYVWGRIRYFDIYDTEQEVRFRFRNVVRELDQDGTLRRWFFYPEQDGNRAT